MFVGKWYMCDDFFKINVMIIVTNDENKNKIISFYLFESYDAWHEILGLWIIILCKS
jgi:hypothetical protein